MIKMEEKDQKKYTILHPNDKKDSQVIEYLFCLASGIFSLAGYFTMVAEADNFNIVYEGMNYSFFVITPQYFAMPISFIISRLITKVPLKNKIYFFMVTSLIGYMMIPVASYFLPKTYFGMIGTLFVYFLGFCSSMLLEGNLIAAVTLFGSGYLVMFFTAQAFFNLILMACKMISLQQQLTILQDFIFIWGLFFLLWLFQFFTYVAATTKPEFRKLDAEQNIKDSALRPKKEKFADTVKTIKWDMLQLFFTMILTFSIFPGVLFSIGPVSIMSNKAFINISNLIVAVFEVLGRPFSNFKFNRLVSKVFFFLQIIINIFLVAVYFGYWNGEYEGLCYTFFVLAGFMIFRTAVEISYFMIEAAKKANDENRESIGIIMTYALYSGITVGNVLSIPLPFIRGN